MVSYLVNKFPFHPSIFILPTQQAIGAPAILTNFPSVEASLYGKSLSISAIHVLYRKQTLQVKTRTLLKINQWTLVCERTLVDSTKVGWQIDRSNSLILKKKSVLKLLDGNVYFHTIKIMKQFRQCS